MTHFLRDILRQPNELQRTIDFLLGAGRPTLDAATTAIRSARHVYLTGIGSSWHAVLTAGPLFHLGARPVYMQDAAELLQFATIPPDSAMIVISLAATVGILASAVVGSWNATLATSLSRVVERTAPAIPVWQAQIADTPWLAPGAVFYFLARGSSLGSCQEARLLWEEGLKSPATAMGTGSFRHGPQEMVNKDARFGMWIDGERMRGQDLAVARDLRQLGASVMLIGRDLPRDAGNLVFQLPAVPPDWQYLIDIIPAQLAAERLAQLSGVDCDSFRYSSFIVEDEYGLLREEAGAPKDEK
jgi:fructoselysine-6-P-deglycase FrlB-like protein